jgi:hypothetical protein
MKMSLIDKIKKGWEFGKEMYEFGKATRTGNLEIEDIPEEKIKSLGGRCRDLGYLAFFVSHISAWVRNPIGQYLNSIYMEYAIKRYKRREHYRRQIAKKEFCEILDMFE